MTDLQTQVATVFRQAGYKVEPGLKPDGNETVPALFWIDKADGKVWGEIPGANGSLEGEVETVLSWLAKAGYIFTGSQPDEPQQLNIYDGTGHSLARGRGDTLHAALAAAVMQLEIDETKETAGE